LRSKSLVALALVAVLIGGMVSTSSGQPQGAKGFKATGDRRTGSKLPKGYVPVIARSTTARYFVMLKAPSVAQRISAAGRTARTQSATSQRQMQSSVASTQSGAVDAVESLGGKVFYRYSKLVNAFSASLTLKQAQEVAARPDVASVEPVGIAHKLNETSVPFIGATKVHNQLNVKGQGMRVAVVDDGIDYTHANFGGPGTVAAYEANNRTIIEPGTFPTNKVLGGFDFVGDNYDVLDDDPSNDTPVEDPDPLSEDIHGTHTSVSLYTSPSPRDRG
jgi:minor extracellular serine protease Vpr